MDELKKQTIRHLFYNTSSFVYNFKVISKFKLELQSGNAQFWSKLAIILPPWSQNLTDDFKNNRACLLYYIKLCASFQSHRWIQTGVTVWKLSIRVKIGDFLSHMALKFDGLPWKTIGHLFYAISSFVHHFKAIWIQTGDTVRKQLDWVLTIVTLTFDLWPWTFEHHYCHW